MSILNPHMMSMNLGLGISNHNRNRIPGREFLVALFEKNPDGTMTDSIGESTIAFVSGDASDLMNAEFYFVSGVVTLQLDALEGGKLFSGGIPIIRYGFEWYTLLNTSYVWVGPKGIAGYFTDQTVNAVKIQDYLTETTPVTTYYVATNGLDTNAGTELLPFLTAAKAATVVEPNEHISLRRGDIFRETLSIVDESVVLRSHGVNVTAPKVTGADIVDTSGVVQDDAVTYPNVYRFNCPHTETVFLSYIGMEVDGVILSRVVVAGSIPIEEGCLRLADEAACMAFVNENVNWYYYNYVSGEHRYSLNTGSNPGSDGKVYEYKNRRYVLTSREYLRVNYITLSSARDRSGVVTDNLYVKRVFENVQFRYGGVHQSLIGGKYFKNCKSVVSPDGATGFHLNSPSTSQIGAAYINCEVSGGSGLAFYNHDAPQPFICLIDCKANRVDIAPSSVGGFANYGANAVKNDGALYIIGAESNTSDRVKKGISLHLPVADTYIEDSIFYAYHSNPLRVNSGKLRVRNSRFLMATTGNANIKSDTLSGLDAVFEYCTFVLDYRGVTYTPNSNDLFIAVNGTGTLQFNKCLFVVLYTNGTNWPRFGGIGTMNRTLTDCQFNSSTWNTTNSWISDDFIDSSDDFIEDPILNGNWAVTETSPAAVNDIGWKDGRASVYRSDAELLANTLK